MSTGRAPSAGEVAAGGGPHRGIAGRPPFAGPTLADVLAAILGREPAPLPGRPAPLVACVMRALAKSTTARFQSARDMHAALAALTGQLDAPARRDEAESARGSARRRRTIDSIAVLPLVAGAADAETEIDYLADGITESLISALSQLPRLKIMARSTVFRYKGQDIDPQQVGQALGVRAVLTGRLRVAADGYVIAVELVDVTDGSHLWGYQAPRPSADAFTLQEEVAGEIAEQLRPRLTSAERRRLVKRHTASPNAFEAYLKGRFHLARRTLDGLTKAVSFFE